MSVPPYGQRIRRHVVRRGLGALAASCFGFALCLLASCTNDPRELRALVAIDNGPTMEVDSLCIDYTEHGRLSSRIFTPKMQSYDRDGVLYDEFLEGIDVKVYNDSGRVTSTIRANYALYWREKKVWEARYRVCAVNLNGDTIRTEQIFWDQQAGRVYTGANVQVRTKDATLYGRGFESDDRFEQWVFREPTGLITIPRPGEEPAVAPMPVI